MAMHQVARSPSWSYAIKANAVHTARNHVTQNHQVECNFISRQLKNVDTHKQWHFTERSQHQWKILFLFRSKHISAKMRIERIWCGNSIRMQSVAVAVPIPAIKVEK